ncbi:MAG TPA: hypothetical protein PLH79_14130 [bacterium]|mgnify:FL=1|nr:hypothetical protein [bacterium]HPP00050.1 hypothetical protein [bacterium]
MEKKTGSADEAAGGTNVGYQIREGEPRTPEAIRAVVSTFPGLESGFRTPLGVTFREALRFQADVMRRIMDRAGKIRLLKELGIDHRVRVSAGTWDVIEPNLLIEIPGDDMQKATLAGALLADGLGQDAFVTAKIHPEGEMLGYAFELERRVSAKDLEDIRNAVNPTGNREGYQFSKTPDGKGVQFLYFGSKEEEENWIKNLAGLLEKSGLKFTMYTFSQDGGLYAAESYRGIIEEIGDTLRGAGRSDLQGRVSDLVRTPYIQEVQRRGWEFDPLQYARSRGWSDAEAREILGDFFPPETHSYQIKEVLERLDPTLDAGSRMAPIRGLSQKTSESILRFIEHVHPGARPFFTAAGPESGVNPDPQSLVRSCRKVRFLLVGREPSPVRPREPDLQEMELAPATRNEPPAALLHGPPP